MITLLLACQIQPPKQQRSENTDSSLTDDSPSDSTQDSSPDTDSDDTTTAMGRTVLLLTIDTLNRDFVHTSINGEAITPELDQLFSDSAYFPNTLATRGQTSPSLASILTGLYPRTTMVRSNPRVLEADFLTLPQRFQAAGYTTIGYSANFCHYINMGIDERRCVHPNEEPDLEQAVADALLVDEFMSTLDQQDPNADLFI